MAEPPSPRRRPSPATIVLALAALIAGAAILYTQVLRGRGGDGIEAAAGNAAQPSAADAIALLEARLREDPDDPADWRRLGWSYVELGRSLPSDAEFDRAMTRAAGAYRRASELEPGNAENWSSLGEVLQLTSTVVSPEAERAFRRAVGLAPRDPRARYFLAVQRDLRGEHRQAVDDWLALLRDTPAGAPWEADLRRTIQQAAERNRIDLAGRMPAPPAAAAAPSPATAAIPGPTSEQMRAAGGMSPTEQSAASRAMVDRLAGRLRANPRDEMRVIMMMRSRMVLGEPQLAREAFQAGLAAYRDDAAAQGRLRQAARELGIATG